MPHDDLDAQLRALPRREVDPQVDARVLRKARAVLAEHPRAAQRQPERDREPSTGVWRALEVFWARALAPALVTGTVAGYLVWAVTATNALYR
jgi:hypothetical protein